MDMVASTLNADDDKSGRASYGTAGGPISRLLVVILCTTYASSSGVLRLMAWSSDAMVVIEEWGGDVSDGWSRCSGGLSRFFAGSGKETSA